MTNKEIKKAVNICCSAQSCTGCPILKIEEQNGLGCKYNLFISAIGLITKQRKEIKSLKTQLEQQRKETAKKILNRINEYNLNYNWDLKEEFIKLCKDYDVEVEDD